MTPTAFAQTATLDEATAVRLALQRPALAVLSRAQTDVARGEALSAGTWPNPEFEYERENNREIENSYRLSQPLNLSGSRSLQEQAAYRRVAATELEAESQRRELATEVRRQFYTVLRADLVAEVARRSTERLATVDVVVRRREGVGETSRYDRLRVAQESATVPVLVADVRAQGEAAWHKLAALIGNDEARRYAGVRGMLLPEPARPLDQYLIRLEDRPGLKALAARAQAFDLERRAAERGFIPDIRVGAGVKTVDDRSREESRFLLSTTIPLPLFDRKQGDALRADASGRVTRAEYELALDQARGEVAAAWHRFHSLHRVATQFRRDSLDRTESLTRIAEAAYRGGQAGVLELVDAYRTGFETERRALELEMEARLAHIELDRLSGHSAQ